MKTSLRISICMLIAFVAWTILVCFVDVQAIGPNGSAVGFATINHFVHNLTGVHMSLYHITDWLGFVPIGFAMGFAFLGLMQWIKRKSLQKVDFSILTLGGFYAVVLAVFIFFEIVIINYRPVLIHGYLEASYPSSTTMLTMCVMPTAAMQLNRRTKSRLIQKCISAFTAFMVQCRLISGVHWFTDIIGGIFLSTGLVMLYHSIGQKQTAPYDF